MKATRFSKRTAEVYCYRFDDSQCRWANFTICEDTGQFAIESDAGAWSYFWPHHGRSSLKAFLAEGDAHYLLEKFSMNGGAGLGWEFDEEATKRGLRKEIAQARRRSDIGKAEARTLWGQVTDSEGVTTEAWVHSLDPELYGWLGEPWVYASTRRTFTYETMSTKVLPFFFGVLRAELAGVEA